MLRKFPLILLMRVNPSRKGMWDIKEREKCERESDILTKNRTKINKYKIKHQRRHVN